MGDIALGSSCIAMLITQCQTGIPNFFTYVPQTVLVTIFLILFSNPFSHFRGSALGPPHVPFKIIGKNLKLTFSKHGF
jgi:hypothetical protein